MNGLALALLFCGDIAAGEVDLTLDPQVAVWAELDSNAPRVPDETAGADDGKLLPPRADEPPRPIADGLMRGEVSLAATVRKPGLLLRSDSAVGVKLFFTQRSERMLVAQSRATLSSSRLPGGVTLTLAAFAKGRAQVSGARTYGLLRTDALVDKAVLDWLVLRVGASGQALQAFDADVASFSSAGASALLGARAALGSAEHVDVLVDAGGRGFPFSPKDAGQAADDPDRRADAVVSGIVQLTSARRLFFSAGYLVTGNASNGAGESFTRHRLFALVGFHLPAAVTCSMQGALQIASDAQGLSPTEQNLLGDDEKSQNFLEITLSRPIWGGFFVEGRASFFGNELAVEAARFSRQTAAIGLRAAL